MKIRKATRQDLPFISELLVNNTLGATMEPSGKHLSQEYITALDTIDEDKDPVKRSASGTTYHG